MPSRGEGARGAGIFGKVVVTGSVFKAINQLFGLYAGADISGTTADTMLAVDYGMDLVAPNDEKARALLQKPEKGPLPDA